VWRSAGNLSLNPDASPAALARPPLGASDCVASLLRETGQSVYFQRASIFNDLVDRFFTAVG
jgi:hypothetical protein